MAALADRKSPPVLHPVRSTPRGRFFRPTRHEFKLGQPGSSDRAVYDSRKARKGRFPLREHHHAQLPHATGAPPVALRLEYQLGSQRPQLRPHLRADITFWVAFFFELGSLVWVANGFCVWLPIELPKYESTTLSRTADALGFVGGTLFLIGAYLGLLEAANRGLELDFGAEAEELLWGRPSVTTKKDSDDRSTPSDKTDVEGQHGRPKLEWQWLPSPRWRELGYLSAAVQMFAATIFWIATLTALPGFIPGFFEGGGSEPIIDVFFWLPQVIGGVGFVVSASILCIEVQSHWWRLKPLSLGWQIGFWNVVGALGFFLCGSLGFAHSSGAIYQSGLTTFWGSWAFLIGSTFQIYEALWREPSKDK